MMNCQASNLHVGDIDEVAFVFLAHTEITGTAAGGVITAAGHGLTDGQTVAVKGLGESSVSTVTPSTFTLTPAPADGAVTLQTPLRPTTPDAVTITVTEPDGADTVLTSADTEVELGALIGDELREAVAAMSPLFTAADIAGGTGVVRLRSETTQQGTRTYRCVATGAVVAAVTESSWVN